MITLDGALAELGLPGATTVLAELGGGPASRSYLLKAAGKKVVLRIDTPLAGSIGLDRRAEAEILSVVAAADLAPELLQLNSSRGLMLTSYIEGTAWTVADLQVDTKLRRLAKALRHLHSLPPTGKEFNVMNWARHYCSQLSTTTANDLLTRMQRLNEHQDLRQSSPVLCHNDPIAANIIAAPSGELRFIDWEYSGVGNAMFDLAVVVAHHDLDEGATHILLEAYAGDVTAADKQALQYACEFYDCLHLLWLMLVAAGGAAQSEQLSRLETLVSRHSVTSS